MAPPARRAFSCIVGLLAASACGDSSGGPNDPDPDPCIDLGVCPPTHPAGRTVTAVDVSGTAFGIAVSESGKVYVTRLLDVSVAFASIPLSGTITQTFPTADVPTDVAFVPGLAKAHVTNQGANNVSVINTTTNLQTNLLPIGTLPYRVLSTSGNRTYVTFGSSKLKVLNSTTDVVTDSISVAGGANGLALSPNGNTLYVSHTGGQVTIISTATHTVIDSFALGGTPQDIAISPDGSTAYVANESAGVQRVNLTTKTVTATLPVPAFGLRLTPDGTQLYVAGGSILTIIDRQTFIAEPAINVGGNARRIAFARGGLQALISNEGGFVTVIE